MTAAARTAFALLPLLLLGASPWARAHVVEAVELKFQQTDREWRLLGEMDIAYMLPELRAYPGGPPMSRAEAMMAAPEELARYRAETEKTLRGMLRMSFGGEDLAWRIEFPDFEKTPFALPPSDMDVGLLTVRLVMPARPGPGDLTVHWIDDGEDMTELIIQTGAGGKSDIVSVPSSSEITLLHVDAVGDSQAAAQSPLWSWIADGYRHVLPTGIDHLLFILGLFFLVPRWKPLAAQSLLFTVAHSITLALAIFGLVHLDPKLVEILIAFSIAFIGVENLCSHQVGKLRYAIVVVFGLVHGLGFASVLAVKLKDLPRNELALPLFGFNVGVELAQISVFIIAFILLFPWKKWTRPIQTVGSVIVALAGTGWMVQRIFF